MNENIWNGIDFNNLEIKSAYDYLIEQREFLEKATNKELLMEIESVDAYLDDQDQYPLVGINKLFIVAPRLGNFRRKILTVMERQNRGRFPVEIFCHIDEKKELEIDEKSFLPKITEILNRQEVQSSILSLYKQSRDANL